MKTKDTQINELMENVEASFNIQCGYCQTIKTIHTANDCFEAAADFYNLGWRIKEDIILCPKCIK